MTLNKVKSDITSVFNTLKNMDLTVDNNGEYSIATQVDLDLATRYPTRAKVTPHLAYLYNTRAGWAQYIVYTGRLYEPINQFISLSGSYHDFVWLNSDKTTRNGSFLECKVYAMLTDVRFHLPYSNTTDLVGYMKNHLNNFTTETVRFCDSYNSKGFPNHPFSSYYMLYTFKYGYLSKPIVVNQSHMINLPMDIDSSNMYMIIHNDGVTKVGLQPLRTMRSDSGAVIGSTNQYIQMNNNMTILIYTNKLVYIQKLNNSYDYKVYTYPQMNLIKTGTENQLRDIYIKNNLTRTGLIGPKISSTDETKYLYLNGFVLNYNAYGISYIIDTYSMIHPKFISTSDGLDNGVDLIYYI